MRPDSSLRTSAPPAAGRASGWVRDLRFKVVGCVLYSLVLFTGAWVAYRLCGGWYAPLRAARELCSARVVLGWAVCCFGQALVASATWGAVECGVYPRVPPKSVAAWIRVLPGGIQRAILHAAAWAPAQPGRIATLLALCAACGGASMAVLALLSSMNPFEVTSAASFGAVLGAVHVARLQQGGGLEAHAPPVQRKRYFRARQLVPSMMSQGLTTALAGTAASVMLSWLSALLRFLGATFAPSPVAVASLPGLLPAAVLVSFGWAAGAAMAEVVWVERLDLAGPPEDILAPLKEALDPSMDSIVQALGAADLAAMAREAGEEAHRRRAAIFADHSGTQWKRFVGPCVAEVRAVREAMRAALPAGPVDGGAAAGPKALGSPLRWNSWQQLSAAGLGGRLRDPVDASGLVDEALWHAERRWTRVRCAVQALGGLVTSARSQDRLGVSQMHSPRAADILADLAALVLAAQRLRVHCGGAGSRLARGGGGVGARGTAAVVVSGGSRSKDAPTKVGAWLARALSWRGGGLAGAGMAVVPTGLFALAAIEDEAARVVNAIVAQYGLDVVKEMGREKVSVGFPKEDVFKVVKQALGREL
ncbi:unnamed protein product [Pedinophyceae sp. YPF-701]|nr:unnamed protein product [Pedinophyceae sp. YPF-701]